MRITCVEIGGGDVQTVVMDGPSHEVLDGAHYVDGTPLLMASPGLMNGTRVFAASNLGWFDVDPAAELGLPSPALLLLNDAHAAALGEYALRGSKTGLTYIGLGTGVGSAIVTANPDGTVAIAERAELGHLTGFSEDVCACGRTGCLETVAAGWALPDPLAEADIERVVAALAKALPHFRPDNAADHTIVLAGGISRRYPEIAECLNAALPEDTVEASLAPAECKSAAAWGLRYAFEHKVTARQLTPVDVDLRELPVPTPLTQP